MSHHFYLPQLSGENIAVPKEHGHWNNNDRKIILSISDAITIDEQAKGKGVSSIPDIWARPLLFQSAIKPKSHHPLKALCTQEWRGLMSLLALHKIKPELADLEIVAITLDGETFSTALRNLIPSDIQLEKGVNYRWTNVLMIRFKGIPVGAFSPSTLVYTGVDYNQKLVNLPFAFKDKEGFLAPPETKEDGLEFLGEWLYTLQQKLNQLFYTDQANPDHLVVGNINDMISTWLKEIRITLGLKENDSIDVKTFKVAEDIVEVKGVSTFLSIYNIYQQLLRPLKEENANQESLYSEILLRSARASEKKVIVINEKIISSPVNIWKELRPRSLDLAGNGKVIIEKFFDKASGDEIDNVDLGKDNGMWIRPELYFLSDKLLRSKDGELLSDSESELNISKRFILPFKKEILDFFSAKEIKEDLNPVYIEDSNLIKFSFYLPVGETKYKIEKTYKTKAAQKEDGEIIEIDAPIIEIFPNYLGINWKKYFLFHGNAERYLISPVAEKGELKKMAKREHEFSENGYNEKIKIYEITGDNPFPEAIEINSTSGDSLGLIMIGKKDKKERLKDKWTIGIDFGTSNTNVFKNGGEDTAERWVYNFPEYYRTVTKCNNIYRKKILDNYFLPTERVELPIPTTLKVYSNDATTDLMLLDYFIYYPIGFKFPENILSDFKWDGPGAEDFLESLFFLLLIEVVKNNIAEVHLASSYPKAFSNDNITVFKLRWEKVFNKLLKPSNSNLNVVNIHDNTVSDNYVKVIVKSPVFRTEGIAAGEYFAHAATIPDINDRANKKIAAICLDVGGGTTDISIWYLDNIEFDASVLLAGRQISNLLQKNSRVRELLFSKEAAIALEEKSNAAPFFSARLNLILKKEEKQIKDNLVNHNSNKDVQWLRQIIALEFGALSFYAAQVCISTNEKVGGLLSRIASDGINLHWGGNAAKLINWIDHGRYTRDGNASKILNATFFKCLDDVALAERSVKPKALMQLQSPGHKSEASGGLVVMDLSGSSDENKIISAAGFQDEFFMPGEFDDARANYAGIVCGENIELVDGKIEFYNTMTGKDLFDSDNKTKFKSTSLARLIRFVDILNFFGIKHNVFTEETKIVLGEAEKRIIRDAVFSEFVAMQKKTEDKRLIEPIFILEIKFLLEILKSKMI